jgi:molybdate transport system ATP-binding protein
MLEVRLLKRFDGFVLDAQFVARAPITALLGRSGSGKTLTVRSIAGAVRPDAGLISLDGEPLFDSARRIDLPPQARRVGYVPQHYALFPHLDVVGNVGFGLAERRQSAGRHLIAEILELVGLSGFERRRPRELSGGQQQRVALARALILQPRILLLDEPFASLDATIRAGLRQRLLDLQRELGFRVLLVTHDPEDATVLAGQTVTFEHGRVVDAAGGEEAPDLGQHRSSAVEAQS